MNPARELLNEDIDSVYDQIEINYPESRHSSEAQDDFEPVQTNSYEPFVTNSGWESFPASSGADIARLLADERPTVVATVLKQVSTQLGAAILAALPSRVATQALSTLPNLDAVDKTIMRDIHETIRDKLSAFRSHLSPDAPDVQHIQSLLAIVPESKRRMLEQDLVVENSSLADSLGISLYGSSLRSENRSMDEDSRRDIRANELIQDAQPSDLTGRDLSEGNDNEYDEQPRLTFDDLEDFPSDSLAIVFRESDPDTILIALTGAAIKLRTRLESMIAPNNLGRLRARFESLKTVGAESRLAARDEIARKANELVRSGRVSIPTLASRQFAA
jgi:flagellar motor switch protein FliG